MRSALAAVLVAAAFTSPAFALPSAPSGAGRVPVPGAAPSPERVSPRRTWMGVTVIDPSIGSLEEGGKAVTGIEVTSVAPGGPSARAGLLPGDVILAASGQRLQRTSQLGGVMESMNPGDALPLKVRRGSATLALKVELAAPPESAKIGPHARAPIPPPPSAIMEYDGTQERPCLGATCLDIGEQLRVFFKAPAGLGVLIESVEPQSPAAVAGLRAGDIVLSIEGVQLADVTALSDALRSRDVGVSVKLETLRDGVRREIQATPRACYVPVWSVGRR